MKNIEIRKEKSVINDIFDVVIVENRLNFINYGIIRNILMKFKEKEKAILKESYQAGKDGSDFEDWYNGKIE